MKDKALEFAKLCEEAIKTGNASPAEAAEQAKSILPKLALAGMRMAPDAQAVVNYIKPHCTEEIRVLFESNLKWLDKMLTHLKNKN